jgi:hypothetical protein
MKKAVIERNIVILLFILVMIVFSLAENDSKKMSRQPALTTSVDSINAPDHTAAAMPSATNNEN